MFSKIANALVPDHHFEHYELRSLELCVTEIIEAYDLVFAQPHVYDIIPNDLKAQVRLFPRANFGGFHPTMIYVYYDVRRMVTIASHHCALVFGGWYYGLTEERTAEIIADKDIGEELRFAEHFAACRKSLFKEWSICGIDATDHYHSWMATGAPFMLTINHPKIEVMLDLTREVLRANGFATEETIILPGNHLADLATMPTYPFVASSLNLKESTDFIKNKQGDAGRVVNLRSFIDSCFRGYSTIDRASFKSNKAMTDTYRSFFEKRLSDNGIKLPRISPSSRTHPYRDIPVFQNWRKSVVGTPIAEVDPVVQFPFKIGPQDRVATAGSCFAQHLAKALSRSGLNYYVPEKGPINQGYGLYSARYGNIYTTLQLSQLIDRAYGRLIPKDVAWTRLDGFYADPFRPEIPISPNSSVKEIEEDRQKHLNFVRETIEGMDYFVFTLGLTECWIAASDGTAFPIAPGVAAGSFSEGYEFCNLDEQLTYMHLKNAIINIRNVNPNVKVILTVSPVPLMATYEKRHVIVSTVLSKAILRVAAERACSELPDVAYFPSYEIITGSFNRGTYFDEDLRSVRPEGVEHVMRLFLKHATTSEFIESDIERQIREDNDILCAEEMLDE